MTTLPEWLDSDKAGETHNFNIFNIFNIETHKHGTGGGMEVGAQNTKRANQLWCRDDVWGSNPSHHMRLAKICTTSRCQPSHVLTLKAALYLPLYKDTAGWIDARRAAQQQQSDCCSILGF